MSCEYENFSFDEPAYKEYLEFQAIEEFNKLRGKPFISFDNFHKSYEEFYRPTGIVDADEKNMADNQKMVKRILDSKGKISLILVSGLPGSDKERLAETLSRLLVNEQVRTLPFQVSNIKDQINYSTQVFVPKLIQFTKGQEKTPQCIVAALPGYNHLKKIIFELRSSTDFNDLFDLKYVITKVHARNFYMNKNRNTYQFLIENCMKGVSNAVVIEKGN